MSFYSSCGSNIKDTTYQSTANENQISSACIDKTKRYLPISVINSRTSYVDKAHNYYPIERKNGFFAIDFNGDGTLDYIFIEKSTNSKNNVNSVIRLVTCISKVDQNGSFLYKRNYPKFTLYESVLPDFQVESHKINVQGNVLIVSRNYHEHNWGSDLTINSYQYDIKQDDFILINQEQVSSSGDGYRNDRVESYNFRNGKYTKQQTCGQFVGPCKSSLFTGSFKIKTITLLNTENIFLTQVHSDDVILAIP